MKGRQEAFFTRSLKIVLACAIAVAPLQIYMGHLSAEQVYHYQPTKLAAMEARWETIPAGEGGDWSLLAIPDRPHQVGLIYYSFRIMIAIGFFLAALMAVSALQG